MGQVLSFFEDNFPCSIPRQQQAPDLELDAVTKQNLDAIIRERTSSRTARREPEQAPLMEEEPVVDDVQVFDGMVEVIKRDKRPVPVSS